MTDWLLTEGTILAACGAAVTTAELCINAWYRRH